MTLLSIYIPAQPGNCPIIPWWSPVFCFSHCSSRHMIEPSRPSKNFITSRRPLSLNTEKAARWWVGENIIWSDVWCYFGRVRRCSAGRAREILSVFSLEWCCGDAGGGGGGTNLKSPSGRHKETTKESPQSQAGIKWWNTMWRWSEGEAAADRRTDRWQTTEG